MRLGIVRGHVTLNLAVPSLSRQDAGCTGAGYDGEPMRGNGLGGGKALVASIRSALPKARSWPSPKVARRPIHSGPMPCRWMRIVP